MLPRVTVASVRAVTCTQGRPVAPSLGLRISTHGYEPQNTAETFYHFENALISVDNTVLQNVKVLYKFLIQKNKLEADSFSLILQLCLQHPSFSLITVEQNPVNPFSMLCGLAQEPLGGSACLRLESILRHL